jgi:(p)ppGpp synthase/HD superfamily hydrolase
MARTKASYLNELSTADLKQLLEARQRIDILEKEKARLSRELQVIEGELKRLVDGVESPASGPRTRGKKAAVKKRPVKKVTKKVVKKVAKEAAKKNAAKKVLTKKKTAKNKVAKKGTGKKTINKKVIAKKAGGSKGAAPVRLEDVVVGIIRKAGKAVPYRDIMGAITKGKLFTSKSANFDNVLRRTLSTSKKVKSAGRGIYDLA